MGMPSFFVENFFSPAQFPDHVVAASSEQANFEAFRVGTARRHKLTNQWRPTSTGQDAWLRVDAQIAREADMIVLDRGHNLAGNTVKLQTSTDDFAADVQDVFSATIPAGESSNGDVDASNGVHTEEGAWLKRFPKTSSRYWRLFIPAAADFRPTVVGVYLGMSWTPGHLLDLPWGEDDIETKGAAFETDALWRSTAGREDRRTGEVGLKLDHDADYQHARKYIRNGFWRGRPMWIIYDDEVAERAVLAEDPGGVKGFRYDRGWSERQARFPWIEREPKVE